MSLHSKKKKREKKDRACQLAACSVFDFGLQPACADLFSHVAWLDWMGLFASGLVFASSSPEPSDVTRAGQPPCCIEAPSLLGEQKLRRMKVAVQSLCRKVAITVALLAVSVSDRCALRWAKSRLFLRSQ